MDLILAESIIIDLTKANITFTAWLSLLERHLAIEKGFNLNFFKG